MKFVHAADLHLDSPLGGLERYDGAPVARIRGASRRALENLVGLCIEEEAAFLLLAGDIYDGDWKDFSTGLFFAAQMSRLRAADIPVVSIRGNHDAASVITRNLRLPDNVRELRSDAPETIELEDLGVAIHGRSYPTRAVTDDLAVTYPQAVAGAFNIGLLHTAATGRRGHENYAPCHLETLRNKGYAYWALGHVHEREVLHEDPWIVFPGNLQGRHMRECGAKGATLVRVEGGTIAAVEHRPLDVVRFAKVVVDLDLTDNEATTAGDIVDLARAALEQAIPQADGRLLGARLQIQGATAAQAELTAEPERWLNELRAVATDIGDGLWLERVELQTRDVCDLAALAERDDAIGQLVRSFADLRADPTELASLTAVLADLRRKLPAELRHGADPIRLEDPDVLRATLDEVEQLLVPRLLQGSQSGGKPGAGS